MVFDEIQAFIKKQNRYNLKNGELKV